MSSRSHYDYSLWPEHARPRRKRFSFKAMAATATILSVCAFAATMVYSEFTQPNHDGQALVGRTWPPQPAAERPQVTPPPVQSAATSVADPADAANSARAAPRVPVNAGNRVMVPTIGTARAAAAQTDGRGGSWPAPDTRSTPAPEAAPAAAAFEKSASAGTASEPKPAVVDKPVRHKRVHRRQERSNTAAVATQVYDYPDGRRVTVYRRLNAPAAGYNGYASSGYGGYGGFGTWRRPDYAERPSGYRPY